MTSFFKSKKVLVAGGAGFVGSNLIKKLLDLNCEIYATYHKKSPQLKDRKVKYIKADLTSKKGCARVLRNMDLVFMCAANTSGAAVIEKNPLVHVTPNILMNTLMLEAAYEAKVKKFLFISSNAVYPPFDHPVKESEMMKGEPYEKYFPVAWMKRFGEILCEIYSTKISSPMTTIVVRPANIYGPYDDFDFKTSHVIPALIRKAVEKHSPLEVWGDGTEIKDLIYAEDAVYGMLLAMEKIDEFKPVNIGTGKQINVQQVLDVILRACNYENAKIFFNKSKPTMIPKRLIDVTLAKRLLGFRAKTSFDVGVRKTIDWYRNSLN